MGEVCCRCVITRPGQVERRQKLIKVRHPLKVELGGEDIIMLVEQMMPMSHRERLKSSVTKVAQHKGIADL
jgi:hypothetical protein